MRLFPALALLLFIAGCAHEPKPTTAAAAAPAATRTPGPPEGETVFAIVERLELAAHEEWLQEIPDVIVSNVVAFGMYAPAHFDTLLFAHVQGHPRIDGRPLLLGDAVSFVLPRDWRVRDLALEDLQGLAFVDPPR